MSSDSQPATAADAAEENKRRARIGLSHLDALERNEDFRWYVKQVLEVARDAERAKALDVNLAPAAADQARWRHDLAATLCGKAAAMRRSYRGTLGLPLDD